MQDAQQINQLIEKRATLRNEVTALFEPVAKQAENLAIIIAGIDEANRVYGADKLNLTYNPSQHLEDDGSHWDPTKTSLGECFSALNTAITNQSLPVPLIRRGEQQAFGAAGGVEDMESPIYNNFGSLLCFIERQFAEKILAVAATISQECTDLTLDAKNLIDADLILAFGLLTGIDGSGTFLQNLKATTNWDEIDQKLEQIAKLNEKIPAHAKGGTAALTSAAAEILLQRSQQLAV